MLDYRSTINMKHFFDFLPEPICHDYRKVNKNHLVVDQVINNNKFAFNNQKTNIRSLKSYYYNKIDNKKSLHISFDKLQLLNLRSDKPIKISLTADSIDQIKLKNIYISSEDLSKLDVKDLQIDIWFPDQLIALSNNKNIDKLKINIMNDFDFSNFVLLQHRNNLSNHSVIEFKDFEELSIVGKKLTDLLIKLENIGTVNIECQNQFLQPIIEPKNVKHLLTKKCLINHQEKLDYLRFEEFRSDKLFLNQIDKLEIDNLGKKCCIKAKEIKEIKVENGIYNVQSCLINGLECLEVEKIHNWRFLEKRYPDLKCLIVNDFYGQRVKLGGCYSYQLNNLRK